MEVGNDNDCFLCSMCANAMSVNEQALKADGAAETNDLRSEIGQLELDERVLDEYIAKMDELVKNLEGICVVLKSGRVVKIPFQRRSRLHISAM